MPRANVARIFIIACAAALLGQVENKAIFGIGMRIIGDQLLLKDVLQSLPAGLAENPTIGFNYAIPEPITYIEILSEENVLAEVNFSYQNDLVKGTVTAINTFNTTDTTASGTDTSTSSEKPTAKAFEVLITIYGFNKTMLNVNPAYLLNRDQQFQGILEPQLYDEVDDEEDDSDDNEEAQYLNTGDEALETFDDTHVDVAFGETDADGEAVTDADFDTDIEHADKVIEVGHRQSGDYLIYETHHTSAALTQLPTNHSVVFYYIDSDFITYAKFVIYDHYIGKSAEQYVPPIAEYSHFSPNTLKAVVTDHDITSLFVQMLLYGYNRTDVPVDYVPFLQKSQQDGFDATDSPMQPLQRLKMLMKADQSGTVTRSGVSAQMSDEDESNESEHQQSAVDASSKVCACSVTVLSVVSSVLFFATRSMM